MAARSTRGIQPWRWACLAALALLAGCQSKNATSPGPAGSMGAPPPVAPAEPETARPAAEAAQPAAGPEAAPPADEPEPTAGAARPGDERSAAGPRDPGEGETRVASVPRPTSTPARPAPPPAGTASPPPQPTPQEGADQDRVNQSREAHATKNTEEPAPAASPSQSVEEFYASLPEQAIAFHVPHSVQRGEMFTVRLVVQPGQSEAALERTLVAIVTDAGPPPAPGDIRTRTTRVGDEMQASISSPTLQIVPRGEDRQLVRRDAVTEWTWYVTANSGGSHRLTLSLYAIPPGRSSGLKVKTFEETLTVEVTFFDEVRDTVADNWEWMWTFVLGPIGALAWRRRQRRHAQAA